MVLFGGQGGHGVFDEDEVVVEVGGDSGGGFDAHVGGDAGEDQAVDASGLELFVQVGSREGTHGALDDHQVAVLDDARDEVAAGRLLGYVRPLDPDADDRRAGLAEGGGEFKAAFEHLAAGSGTEGETDDPVHQVDQDKRGSIHEAQATGYPDRMTVETVTVATQNLWRFHDDWNARREVLQLGFRALRPDIAGFQEAILTEDYEQPRDILGDEFHYVHQKRRESDGSGVSIASRWPIGEVRELDGRLAGRAAGHPFTAGTLVAEILAPEPLGRMLFVNHIPSWQQDWEHERELQTIAATRLIDEMGHAHVVLAGDLDAEPEASSIRFLRGMQSLGGTSVKYRDAWSSCHPGEAGHTFSPENPMVIHGEGGAHALELGRRIDHILVRGGEHGPTLDIRGCERLFDKPVDGVWASDHFGLTATLSALLPDGRPVP